MLRNSEGFTTTEVLAWVGIPLAVVLIAAVAWPAKQPAEDLDELEDDLILDAGDGTIVGPVTVPEARGRYPVPPLDLKVPIPPIRAKQAAAQRALAANALQEVGAGSSHELPGGSDVIS